MTKCIDYLLFFMILFKLKNMLQLIIYVNYQHSQYSRFFNK